jgi:hypothetical protein
MCRVYGVPKADEESESAAYDSRRESWDQRQIKARFQAMIRRQDAGQERLVSWRRRGEARRCLTRISTGMYVVEMACSSRREAKMGDGRPYRLGSAREC